MAKVGRKKQNLAEKVDFKQLFRLCAAGLTDQQIAVVFNITRQTVCMWKKHPRFLLHLKKGKDVADDAVERSLWERATGYEHEDVHISNYQGKITVTQIVKHYPPDTMACIYWLNNRRREEWKQRQEVELGAPKGKRLIIEDEA